MRSNRAHPTRTNWTHSNSVAPVMKSVVRLSLRQLRLTRPTAPSRTGEWGGVLMGARASRNRADAAVGGDGEKKRQRFRCEAARYAL